MRERLGGELSLTPSMVQSGWHSVDTTKPHGVGLWRYISRGGGCFLAILDSI